MVINVLTTKNLNFSFGKQTILNGISIAIQEGEMVSLLGPNGSGKSTLLRCLAKLYATQKNEVYLMGRPINEYSKKEMAQNIAFLPQVQEPVTHMKVWDLVAFGRSPYQKFGWVYSGEDKDIISWAMDYMHIIHLKDKYVNELSGGEKQRVWIAMILAQNTPIIFLDEPSTYMDLKHQWDLLKIINGLKEEFNKTIVSVFHDLNHALEISDKVILLKEGHIYATGSTKEVITEQAIEDVYDMKAKVCHLNIESKSHCLIAPLGR